MLNAMILLLQEKMIGVSSEKKNIWLHYSVLSIIIIVFGVPPEAKALPHAIRIGAIFTGKTRNKNQVMIHTNYDFMLVVIVSFYLNLYFYLQRNKRILQPSLPLNMQFTRSIGIKR